jgi:hypothetical protein
MNPSVFEYGPANTTRVVVVKDQVSANLAGEAVILNLKSGIYYGLDEVGARIWSLIQQPKSVDEIVAGLLAEYQVEPERCQRDLLALLKQLAAANLIEVQNEPAA